MSSSIMPVLIAGRWQASDGKSSFTATNPTTGKLLPGHFPVSDWFDLDRALSAASNASAQLRDSIENGDRVARFLNRYAEFIEQAAERLAQLAHLETGLAIHPRLQDTELLRTVFQLRQAAECSRAAEWRHAVIDRQSNIRSCHAPLGVVWTIGPNNFPFAYNGISGGDFASALAAGNAVIAKAHPLHPGTTHALAELAANAAVEVGLPAGAVQMIYHVSPEDGLRLIADARLSAVGFTGSRAGGLKLKAAADAAGKPFFGEMSSVNPVVLLPGALSDRSDVIADQLVTSVTSGAGQFCTKPGLIFLLAGESTQRFTDSLRRKMNSTPAETLLSAAGRDGLLKAIEMLVSSGAELLTGGRASMGSACRIENTLLRVSAARFIERPNELGAEAFGNATVLVVADSTEQIRRAISHLEGNLTGSIYSAADGSDETIYTATAGVLRNKVGRLLNDKMPTGVTVTAAMNHGGPFPATSHPHFTAVGMPAAIDRFTKLECYDNVRYDRLPLCLRT